MRLLPSSSLSFIFCFFLLFVTLHCYAAPPPASITIGCILPLSKSPSFEKLGKRSKFILETLVNDINGGVAVGGFPANYLGVGVELVLDCRDSEAEVLPAMRALHALKNEHGSTLMGVIGCLADSVTVPLDYLAQSLDLVMVSPAATSASLATEEHPFFVSHTHESVEGNRQEEREMGE